jgi:hypothetical protein
MNALSKNLPSAQHLGIAGAIAFFMLLTRGSHVLTQVSLPDASLVLFLLGGLFLKRAGWFVAFFMLATVIDFGAAAFDPAQGFCLTAGYWGMVPAYGVMWLGGRWLAKQNDAFSALPYAFITLVTTLLSFVISTQTYYLLSGRFPDAGVIESMKHGWEYLPSYVGFTAMYFGIVWASAQGLRRINVKKPAKA